MDEGLMDAALVVSVTGTVPAPEAETEIEIQVEMQIDSVTERTQLQAKHLKWEARIAPRWLVQSVPALSWIVVPWKPASELRAHFVALPSELEPIA
jgi:hypothetical protein